MPKITNEEQALARVRQDGKALESVSEKFKTAEIRLEAVKNNGDALEYIHEPLRGEVLRAFKNAL